MPFLEKFCLAVGSAGSLHECESVVSSFEALMAAVVAKLEGERNEHLERDDHAALQAWDSAWTEFQTLREDVPDLARIIDGDPEPSAAAAAASDSDPFGPQGDDDVDLDEDNEEGEEEEEDQEDEEV